MTVRSPNTTLLVLALGSTLAIGASCDSKLLVIPGDGGDKTVDAMGQAADADPNAPDADPNVVDEKVTITYTAEDGAGRLDFDDEPNLPTNIVATWIEAPNGDFVKTVNRQSGTRTQHLAAWNAASGGAGEDTDAVTGATRANFDDAITATWEIPDGLADGTYTVRFEICEGNSGTDPTMNTQGTFTFEKDGTAVTQTPGDDTGYSGVTIEYTGR